MAKRLMDEYRNSCEILVLFANTGQEAEETLNFVQKCNREFKLNVIWIEAKVNAEKGRGTEAKITNHLCASRNGEPFEAVIKKYGIPNRGNPVCTRELKITPMQNYLRSIGWKKNKYTTAIGIRVDELDRQRADAEQNHIIYPLIDWNIDKPAVNRFWESQDFRLNLRSWEGNCKTCWKKSNRKLYQIAKDHPEWFDFFTEMESQYSSFTPEGRKNTVAIVRDTTRYNDWISRKIAKRFCPVRYESTDHFFFSRNRNVASILRQARLHNFEPPTDDRIIEFDDELDALGECTESCEAY